MSVKERILTIRLMEKVAEKPVLMEVLGVNPIQKIAVLNQQNSRF